MGVRVVSVYAQYQNEFNMRAWADSDPAACGCGGVGWAESQMGVWVKCPRHKGQHPEDDSPDLITSWEVLKGSQEGFDGESLPSFQLVAVSRLTGRPTLRKLNLVKREDRTGALDLMRSLIKKGVLFDDLAHGWSKAYWT